MMKLVITDLDGTFLNNKEKFDSERFKKTKKIMDDYGIAFAACTGKQCERVEELLPKKDYGDMWILGDSATRIKYKGEYIYESLLPNVVGQDGLMSNK